MRPKLLSVITDRHVESVAAVPGARAVVIVERRPPLIAVSRPTRAETDLDRGTNRRLGQYSAMSPEALARDHGLKRVG